MHRIPGGMSKRSAAGTTLIALGLATTSLGFLGTGTASATPKGDPGGNNGTVKVENVDVDNKDAGRPENNPHLPCTFTVEWWNFDQGDYYSDVSFELKEPTGPKDHTMSVSGPSRVFIGEDPADGAGAANGRDASVVYTLSFTGDPHPKQGFHVKLTTHNGGSKGADTKYKTFWVGPCETTEPSTPASSAVTSATTPISSAVTSATTPISSATTPVSSATTPISSATTPVSSATTPISSATTPVSTAPTSASTQPSTPESSSATVLPTSSESVPESSTTPTVLPTSSTAPPKHHGKPSTTPTVLPSQRTAPGVAPTAVDAGLAGDGGDGGIPSSLLILLGAAMAVLGLGVGFVPIVARGKHSH